MQLLVFILTWFF